MVVANVAPPAFAASALIGICWTSPTRAVYLTMEKKP